MPGSQSICAGETISITKFNTVTSGSDQPVWQAYARRLLLSCLATLSIAPTSTGTPSNKQVLQGYVREIPAHTIIPIVFNWTVNSETTQDGDEFLAKTTEDQTIDGHVVLPAGSIIKGKSSLVKSPLRVKGKNSIELKFETVTTPNKIQSPIVARVVAHNGIVHIQRGARTISIPAAVLPVTRSPLICTWSNQRSTHKDPSLYRQPKPMSVPNGLQTQILLSTRAKGFAILPGDEVKIELVEGLRMSMVLEN